MQQASQGEVIKHRFALQVEPTGLGLEVDVQPIGAAQYLVVKKQEKHHLGKRHGHHDEINAVGAHHKKADHQCGQPSGQHRDGQAPPQAHGCALGRHKGQHITGQTEVGRMAQGHQAGHTLEQIQAHGKNTQNHHAGDHLQIKVGAHKGKGSQRHHGQGQGTLHPAWQGFQMGLRGTHERAFIV
jgi:hypothetical protein